MTDTAVQPIEAQEEPTPASVSFWQTVRHFISAPWRAVSALLASLGEKIRRLYQMLEASMAQKMYRTRNSSQDTRYSRVSVEESLRDEAQKSEALKKALLQQYHDSDVINQHALRLFVFPRQESTENGLSEISIKSRELMRLLLDERKDIDFIEKRNGAVAHFVLLFIQERHHIRHLDFSSYAFTGNARARFEYFLTELLDCYPYVTHITFHPDNQAYFEAHDITKRLQTNRAIYSAEKILNEKLVPPHPLANEETARFFEQEQIKIIQRYDTKTEQLLMSITPESEQPSMSAFLSTPEDTPIALSSPWHWVLLAGREIKMRLSHLMERKSFTPVQETDQESKEEAPLENKHPIQQRASETTALIRTDNNPSSTYGTTLSLISSVASSFSKTFNDAVTGISQFFYKKPTVYFLSWETSDEEQLKACTQEAQRIISLWKEFEKTDAMEATTDYDKYWKERIKARIVDYIVYKGLYPRPSREIGGDDKPPEKQKVFLLAEQGYCRRFPWNAVYSEQTEAMKSLHREAFEIVKHSTEEWFQFSRGEIPDKRGEFLSEYMQEQVQIYIENEKFWTERDIFDAHREQVRKIQTESSRQTTEEVNRVLLAREAQKKKKTTALPPSNSHDSFFSPSPVDSDARKSSVNDDKNRSRSHEDANTETLKNSEYENPEPTLKLGNK